MIDHKYTAVSLFSGSGLGDIGFKASGADFIVMNELLSDRAQLLSLNFPMAIVINKDILECYEELIKLTESKLLEQNKSIFLITCTAPCQGMSKSGQGTLLKNIREKKRPKLDFRNRLIIPALKVISHLCPEFVVFENVCEMRNTVIENDFGEKRLILDIIKDYLEPKYLGEAYDVEMADYGVPQRRKRLITVFTRNAIAKDYYRQGIDLIPESFYSCKPELGKMPWISVSKALKGFPVLDAKSPESAVCSSLPFHRVPVIDRKKYEWIKYTPTNKSAFDNQCINPRCKYQGNTAHGTKRNGNGINQANKDTPLYCMKCGSLLPRPYVKGKDGTLRIMSGYTSAYKRMDPNLPCPTLTRNMSFPCSDHKVHFSENRVLSLAEAFHLHTLDRYNYKWGPIKNVKGEIKKYVSDTTIRESIGESIPPYFLEMLGNHLQLLTKKKSIFYTNGKQLHFLKFTHA